MKKHINRIIMLILVIVLVAGCSGSSSKTKAKRYVYKWEDGATSGASLSALSVSKTMYGPEVPPLAAISRSDTVQRAPDIYVYEQTESGVLTAVTAEWACDADVGGFGESYSAHRVSFYAAKIGLQNVTATINDTILTIPIHVYPFVALHINEELGSEIAYDFDNNTWSNDITENIDIYIDSKTGNIYFPYGFQRTHNMSALSTAPSAGYGEGYIDKVGAYVLKTSEGKYAKIDIALTASQTGYGDGVGFSFLVSDSEGQFEY